VRRTKVRHPSLPPSLPPSLLIKLVVRATPGIAMFLFLWSMNLSVRKAKVSPPSSPLSLLNFDFVLYRASHPPTHPPSLSPPSPRRRRFPRIWHDSSCSLTYGRPSRVCLTFSFSHPFLPPSLPPSLPPVLVVDEFLASGTTAVALSDIVRQAGAAYVNFTHPSLPLSLPPSLQSSSSTISLLRARQQLPS